MTTLSKPARSPTLFSYVTLAHAIAGGCGSAFAMTTFYPLDIVRTRLQLEDNRKSKNTFATMRDIYQQEGLQGLYRGLLPVIQSLYCSNFVYFYTFHALKRFLNREKSIIKDLFLGMIAGTKLMDNLLERRFVSMKKLKDLDLFKGWVNVLTTTPLWVVNTRMKMQGTKLVNADSTHEPPPKKYAGLLHGLLKIGKDEGVAALWAGAFSSLILAVNPAIQFMTYEALKRRMERVSGGEQLGVSAAFFAGAAAKAIATILTYPLQLIQTKQRHGHNYPGLAQKAGIIPMIVYIVKLQGAKGLFKGLEAKMLQTVLTAALMFVFYEKIASSVLMLLLRTNGIPKR